MVLQYTITGSGNEVKGTVEYRRPPMAVEDMPQKSLDGVTRIKLYGGAGVYKDGGSCLVLGERTV